MKNESDFIRILCGRYEDSYTPLSRAEFWKLYHKYDDSVEKLVNSDEERVKELLKRSASIAFSEEKLGHLGIKAVSFLEDDFPRTLYTKLKDFCSPLFYMCGDPSILNLKFAGYVGSRSIGDLDVRWTENAVKKNLDSGFSIVSGGAKGIDSVSLNCALLNSGKAIAYLPDNINVKINDSFYRNHIIKGNLLALSHISPFEKKTRHSFVAAAMERNKFIYAQAKATAVVKSDYKKGGTWAGATETLKHKWGIVFAWDNKEYIGNQELIKLGAKPLDDDGEIGQTYDSKKMPNEDSDNEKYSQMSFFDIIPIVNHDVTKRE